MLHHLCVRSAAYHVATSSTFRCLGALRACLSFWKQEQGDLCSVDAINIETAGKGHPVDGCPNRGSGWNLNVLSLSLFVEAEINQPRCSYLMFHCYTVALAEPGFEAVPRGHIVTVSPECSISLCRCWGSRVRSIRKTPNSQHDNGLRRPLQAQGPAALPSSACHFRK